MRIWDLPTRLFHWGVVFLVGSLWLTADQGEIDWHKRAGFALLALLAFRLFWGVAGSETARFSRFVRGPREIWRYLRGEPQRPGHNPLGALSVVAMLAVLCVEAVLGLFAIDEDGLDAGPFAPMVGFDGARLAAYLHGLAFNVLLGFVALHVATVLVYLVCGNNLIGPMITGRKRAAEGTPAPRFAPSWFTVIGCLLAVATYALLWRADTL